MDANGEHTGDAAGRRDGKKGGRKGNTPKVALNLRLDEDVHTQLKVHALLSKSTASDVVSELVRKHLKVYTVTGPSSSRLDGVA